MGGFECSTHRNGSRKRLDVIAASRHDEFAREDYQRLLDIGIGAARDGLRWHLIEAVPGSFDMSSIDAQIEAANSTGLQVIWDLFHFGYPDHIDILSDSFPERFASYGLAAVEHLARKLEQPVWYCPVNEFSYFSWAAGRVAAMAPYRRRKAHLIKRNLVKAAILTVSAVRDACPDARTLFTEPAVHVVAGRSGKAAERAAEAYRLAQFEALDMLTGGREPELGGSPDLLDVIGLNYYIHDQWTHPTREWIPLGDPRYRPPRDIFREYYERYRKPIIISETGIEDEMRPEWFRFVAGEALAARSSGVPLEGLCLYPILNHPGWEDDRHCYNGLWDYADDSGRREAYEPLLSEIMKFGSDSMLAASATL